MRRHSGGPPFHLGEVERETVFSEMVTHALFPSSPNEWQSFNVRQHQMRFLFPGQSGVVGNYILFTRCLEFKAASGKKKKKSQESSIKMDHSFFICSYSQFSERQTQQVPVLLVIKGNWAAVIQKELELFKSKI